MKIGDRVTGTVKAGNPSQPDFAPTGLLVDISGDNGEIFHVYTQYGAVWRIPAADCQPTENAQ